MYSKSLIALGALAALPQVLATVFITSPIATTTCQGGQVCMITWKEDDANTAPLLAAWGPTSVGVYAGSAQQQTLLQPIQETVDVAKNAGIQFTVNPGIGPNSNQYFIRFQSSTVRDPTNPTFPLQAFSAKFTLAGMSGQFNASVQAQISGAAPPAGATSTTSTSSSSTSSRATTSAGSTTSKSTTSAPAATSNSAAAGSFNLGAAGVVAPVVAAFFALL